MYLGRSLFSPPLNTWHQLFNGSGSEPARYLAVTTAPTMINLLHNLDFIFHNDFAFTDRFDARQGYFKADGALHAGDYRGFKFVGNVWETNFVPDARGFKLLDYDERGAGGSNIKFELSEKTTACHISEFPVGTYAGAHVIIISGDGYSLIWPDGAAIKKYDWHEGSMVVPPENWWHQHFNAGDKRRATWPYGLLAAKNFAVSARTIRAPSTAKRAVRRSSIRTNSRSSASVSKRRWRRGASRVKWPSTTRSVHERRHRQSFR